ncbi:thioredoxin family protein [Pontiellaceae bacterium B1224]|nr:thioredoxin family protein [Pontiellaceae bacterium B1224]
MSMQKFEFTDANFDAETSKGLSVVCFEEPSDFDCQRQAKVVEKAAAEITENISVGKCDIERCTKLAERFRITSIPTTLVFFDGKEVERLVGYRHEMTLVKHLKKDIEKDA